MAPLDSFDPAASRERWLNYWETHKFYRSQPNPAKKPYTIVIPPPNVTGALHLGHALNGTLQDVMIRFKRMQGYEALWMPGADHAGIATQAVVERRLLEEEGKTRHDIGRDALIERIWQWKDQYEARIKSQIRALGASCDWSRWRFTLDEMCCQAVRQTFFNLFRDGSIYRGKRLVNWDCKLQTAVADDEIEDEKRKGSLWHIAYPVVDNGIVTGEVLVVATTRPETMLGDTAVAIHSTDPRYLHLHGKQIRLPLTDRIIPIVCDDILVDPSFGSGAVKVTPAHDPNDYQCGLRQKLPMINILTPDGKINENGGAYQGLPREEARKRVVADLEAQGFLQQVVPHENTVPISDRSKTIIEPYLSDQWFIKMDHLAELAIQAVQQEKIKIIPARYAEMYLRWLGEKRDWCISRQLFWGHRIPIWYCQTCQEEELQAAFGDRPDITWRYSEELQHFEICGVTDLAVDSLPGHQLRQDDDVLDTWFSSGLWPHSTLGWPGKTPELEYYYPTDLLSTAREIITLWVARMVVFSEYNLQQIPFREVFIHPVIQDGNGRPMKKSLGNGVDPFDIIEKYGADALRYTLTAMTTETQDVRMPVTKETQSDGREINISTKFELGRNFATKIFNASKLVLSHLEDYPSEPMMWPTKAEDRWILDRLTRTTQAMTTALETYQFDEVGRLQYEFFWTEFCDWYLELIKPRFREPAERAGVQQVAAYVLDHALRLLHPVLPFVTEEVWHAFAEVAPIRHWPAPLMTPATVAPSLIVAPWPETPAAWQDDTIARQFADMQEVIRAIRNLRAEFDVSPKVSIAALVDAAGDLLPFLQENGSMIQLLANVGDLQVAAGLSRPAKSAAQVLPNCRIYVPLAEHINIEAEVQKQNKKLENLNKQQDSIQKKLADEKFVSKAPPEVIQQQRDKLAELQQQATAIEAILVDLKS